MASEPATGDAGPTAPPDAPPAGMRRYRLVVEFDGGPFVGWQRQANGLSVQQAIEQALEPLEGRMPLVQGAGRTDAGVHATAMAAHIDLARSIEPARLMAAINFHVRPHPIAVVSAGLAPPGFHARFSAVERRYRYRLLVRSAPPVLDRGQVWHIRQRLDIEAMRRAAAILVGRHDFTSFRSTACQAASATKTLDALEVAQAGDEVVLTARARSFLHNQVRIIVGTLKRVGEGAWTPGDVQAALDARDRGAGGPTAPPEGLCLVGVRYPDGWGDRP